MQYYLLPDKHSTLCCSKNKKSWWQKEAKLNVLFIEFLKVELRCGVLIIVQPIIQCKVAFLGFVPF